MNSLMKGAALLAVALTTEATAVRAEPWTPAWLASPQRVWNTEFAFPTGLPEAIGGTSIRQPLTLGWSGQNLRLILSNRYGTSPLPITGVSVARSAGGAEIAEPQVQVTVGGEQGFAIPPAAEIVSDPAPMNVIAGDRIAVTTDFGSTAITQTFHWDARETGFVIADGVPVAETTARIALAGVLVDQPAETVVVAMGDSITDGNGAPMDKQARWPDYLSRRLAPEGVAVVNAGISGNRLLTDGMGESLLTRLDRDLLSLRAADTLILLIGTNDIAWPGSEFAPDEPPMTLDRLKAGYLQLVEKLHAGGLRLIVGTLPPFQGALPGTPMEGNYWTAEKDVLRNEFNDWLREADFHDGLVDFDKALRDPNDPTRLQAVYDSGDHLHPGAAGNEAMANLIDSAMLKGAMK